MKRPFQFLPCSACLSVVLFCVSVQASGQESVSRYEQRQLYQEALRYLFADQNGRFDAVAERLTGYPLAPYLEYFDISRHISRYSHAQIEAFMERNADSPIAIQLMRSWLYWQGVRGHWETFASFYDDSYASPILTCYHLYALYRTGREQEALELTTEQWLVGHSQPDECDPIFKIWRNAGFLTQERAWQRMSLALDAGNTSLAGYIANFLSRERHSPAQLLRQVHRSPGLLRNEAQFLPDSPEMRDIIRHGVTRLAVSDSEQALDLWQHFVQTHAFTQEEIDDTYLDLAILLAVQRDPGNRIESLPVDLVGHPILLESLIRLSLYREDWGQVLVFINALPADRQQTPRWQFWKARVLALSTDEQDRQSAIEILRQLAAIRGYYSFLAADILGYPYAMDNLPTPLAREEISAVEQRPGIQRALELFVLKERTRARSEWRFAVRDFDDRQLAAAARVAQNWGWYEQSIQTLLDSDRWDDLRIRFPLAYHDTFLSESKAADIPVTWSLAIARQESAFMPDARSTAGALGVMQLMPATARITADSFGIDYRDTNDLKDPVTNISLGTAYLGQMFRRFDNNRILASAAYNAGPRRVEKWIEKNGSDFDVWIETLPFSETRNYVENILFFSVIFAYRLDQAQHMILPGEREQFVRQQISQRDPEPHPEPSS